MFADISSRSRLFRFWRMALMFVEAWGIRVIREKARVHFASLRSEV